MIVMMIVKDIRGRAGQVAVRIWDDEERTIEAR